MLLSMMVGLSGSIFFVYKKLFYLFVVGNLLFPKLWFTSSGTLAMTINV